MLGERKVIWPLKSHVPTITTSLLWGDVVYLWKSLPIKQKLNQVMLVAVIAVI